MEAARQRVLLQHPAASAANDTVDEDGKVNGIMYQEGLPLVDEGDYTFSIFCDDSSESGEFIMLESSKNRPM